MPIMSINQKLIGKRFGKLVVLSYARDFRGRLQFLICKCNCRNYVRIAIKSLLIDKKRTACYKCQSMRGSNNGRNRVDKDREPLTKKRIKQYRANFKNEEYMKEAIEGAAEKITNGIFTKDYIEACVRYNQRKAV